MNLALHENSLEATIATLRERLLAARGPQGYWTGHLSGSALSTATAVFALAVVDRGKYSSVIERGLDWLCRNQNADGGWGDTTQSPSNLSTTMLCYSAIAIDFGFRISGFGLESRPAANPPSSIRNPQSTEATARAESWLRRTAGSLESQALARAVERQYGGDRTFSAPILTMCALAGRLGTGGRAWRLVRPLPFELAVLPHRLYKWLRLPVVSYALPALIAIGQARYEHRRPRNPLVGVIRSLSRERSLRVLTRLQPQDGGFLEAAPLTSFVVMSLASSGHADHEVVARGTEFLVASIREDGSWPIDTNLATWVTTLSVNALSDCGLRPRLGVRGDMISDCGFEASPLTSWLLSCQQRAVHPYTHAEPGGWGWSNLPGAVPDADDTAGALVALHTLSAGARESAIRNPQSVIVIAACAGIEWLLGLQNGDGGIPTFCRGWTKLPFDRSAPDLTAHALAAMSMWLPGLPTSLRARTEKAMRRALQYLRDAQQADGSWLPLWFGNQSALQQANPVYGTSRALTHLANCGLRPRLGVRGDMIADCGFDTSLLTGMQERAAQWLLGVQNTDGGWGGAAAVKSSIEETALAVDALATGLLNNPQSAIPNPQSQQAAIESICRGADWLIRNTAEGQRTEAAPIGLYFARLWYFEELYPIIFALSALGKVRRLAAK